MFDACSGNPHLQQTQRKNRRWVAKLCLILILAAFFKKLVSSSPPHKEEELEPGAVDYIAEVVTGDVKGAGTNANVHLVLIGDKGESKKVIFQNQKTHFDKGKLDTFNFKAKDVGDIKKIRIGHDNTGFGASTCIFLV